jgi:hypothetical protein
MEEASCDFESAMEPQSSFSLEQNLQPDPENWADFDASPTKASSTNCPPQTNPQSTSSQSSLFETFDSSWKTWILNSGGGSCSLENQVINTSQEEDVWTSQLLPLQDHTTLSRKIPVLRRNPRDSFYQLHLSRPANSDYNHYQMAYTENDTSDPTSLHLSNEEWITQRRRRDGQLQRRFQQEVEQMFIQQQVFRSSSEHRIMQRIVADGQMLLSYEPQAMELNGTDDSDESLQQHSPQRIRARRMPVSSQARRERFQHWSTTAVQLSLDLALVPWRMIFRSDSVVDNSQMDQENERSTSSTHGMVWSEQGEGRFFLDSLEQESQDPSFSWPSGQGWHPRQEESSHEDDIEGDESSDLSGRTRYWSTGTAMETDFDSCCSLPPPLILETDDTEEPWENASMQFPSLGEEDPHQYEFMPTAEDPLFPEEPFADSFQ